MDTKFADQVLQAAISAGNSREDLQKHLNSLDSAGQEQFINETASALGVSAPEAVGAGQFNMTGPEAAVLGASQALPVGKVLAPVSGAIEQGIAKLLPEAVGGISPQAYQEMYGNQTPTSLGQETSQMLGSAQAEHPLPYALGQAGGAMALTAPFGAAGATLPFMAGQGALTGALETEGGLQDRALGAAKGAVIGAVAGQAAKGLGQLVMAGGKAVGGLAGSLGEASTAAARRAVGFTKGLIAKAGGTEAVNEMIRTLQKAGLFTKGFGLDKIAEQVGEHGQSAINSLDNIYGGPLGGMGSVAIQDLKTAIANRVRAGLEKVRELNPAKLTQLDQVDALIARVGEGKEALTNADLWQLTKDVGSKAWEKGVMNENLSVFQDVWKVLKDATEKGIKQAPGGEQVFGQVQQANKLYRASQQVGKAISDKLDRQAVHSTVGLAKIGATAIGGTMGGIPGAISGAVGEHLASAYGMQAASQAAKKASEFAGSPVVNKMLKLAPKLGQSGKVLLDAVSRGPAAVSAAHYVLQKRDPEYQKEVQKVIATDEGNSNGQ